MRYRKSGSQLVVTMSRSSPRCSRTRVGTDTRPLSSSVCSNEPTKPLRAGLPPFPTLVDRSRQPHHGLSSFARNDFAYLTTYRGRCAPTYNPVGAGPERLMSIWGRVRAPCELFGRKNPTYRPADFPAELGVAPRYATRCHTQIHKLSTDRGFEHEIE